MRLHPPRQPRGKNWLYCRLCDLDVRKTDRLEHDHDDDHLRLMRAFRTSELLDRLVPNPCPGKVYFHAPWAAVIDNILYDAEAAARAAVLTGVSLRRPTGR